MTAPTREQVEEWGLAADRYASDAPGADDAETWVSNRDAHLAALAFAAGQSGQASGSGAELVREVEEAAQAVVATSDPNVYKLQDWHRMVELLVLSEHFYWPRLRAALISGDAAREDVERLATAHESVLRSLQKQAPRFEDTDRLDMIETKSWYVGKYESNRFYVHLGQINGKQCETTGATLREAIDRARGGK